MAGVLGRLENWVLGEGSATSDLFAAELRVETPHGVESALPQPGNVRMIASGGDNHFGTIVYDHQDSASEPWIRTSLVYFANAGLIHQVYVQHSEISQRQGS